MWPMVTAQRQGELMNGLREYVWAHALASKLTIHGFSVPDAAREADEALKEFDKRNFDAQDNFLEQVNAQQRERITHLEDEVERLGAVVAEQAAQLTPSA